MKRHFLLLLGAILALCFFTVQCTSGASDETRTIRRPVVSGTFYPADPKILRDTVEGFLSQAHDTPVDGELFGLAVPHAGYIYSGGIAAQGYALIRNMDFDAVVIMAPSHHYDFPGASIYSIGDYQTPLGIVRVDRGLSRKLESMSSRFHFEPLAHKKEHSLEVQLPFLQVVMPDTPIVPIVIGDQSFQTCTALSDALLALSREKKLLFLVSTDLSHYYPYDTANKMDQSTLEYIRGMQWNELYTRCLQRKNEMCGLSGMITLMLMAEKIGITEGIILQHANSGDTQGDKTRVVGYAAIAFVKRPDGRITGGHEEEGVFTRAQKQRLLEIARDSIREYVTTGKRLEISIADPALTVHSGAFVTLKENGVLRGCIGQFIADRPLYEVVREMAIAAAVRDTRFRPVRPEEIDAIHIHISVLSPLKRVASPDDVILGTHGIYIRQGFRSGTFLPEVAAETGWSKEEFIEHCLVDKAGLSRDALTRGAELYIYTTESFSEDEIR
ncbi:MAG: AmmeMemoRadiSam system protein B [Candidatus Omnitrophica bacterium]|nr:AmmeMemoRadiSam system protein B [Candidatus Omnitrophota bacterium]